MALTNLSWDLYSEKIKKGFINLQQGEEFVDMTLCAEGYLVKVHRNIVSLVSPYLREMIKSTSCQHPVIFLSNISHEVLSHIIEYIYTGESQIPSNVLPDFLKAASDLSLSGLSNNISQAFLNQEDQNKSQEGCMPSLDNRSNIESVPGQNEVITISSCENAKHDILNEETYTTEDFPILSDSNIEENLHTYNTIVEPNPADTSDKNDVEIVANVSVNKDYKAHQYSVSSRGSLQLILNRYIYYLHHQAERGVKKRWRCFDYRRCGCKAYVDTKGEEIIERRIAHNHGFHDDKILKKVREKQIFGTICSLEVKKHVESQNECAIDEDCQ